MFSGGRERIYWEQMGLGVTGDFWSMDIGLEEQRASHVTECRLMIFCGWVKIISK